MKIIFLFLSLLWQTSFSCLPVSAQTTSEKPYLLLLSDSEERVLAAFPVRDGEAFAIRYIHSVALTPVEDYFLVSGKEIVLDKTVYQDFGAGLPHLPQKGQTMSTENGHIILSGINRKFSSFDLRVGRVADHTLLLDVHENGDHGARPAKTRSVRLSGLCKPGETITFSVTESSLHN